MASASSSVSAASARLDARTREVLDMICEETGIAKDFIEDQDIYINDEYIGPGYGRPTDAGIAAIRMVAENEGAILDPIYTGKCMSGMLDMLNNGKLENPADVVFLHTGGAPAIHPYADYFRV